MCWGFLLIYRLCKIKSRTQSGIDYKAYFMNSNQEMTSCHILQPH